jgi:hypothetical protein
VGGAQGCACIGIDVDKPDPRALVGESGHDLGPDSRGATSDKDNLSGKAGVSSEAVRHGGHSF